MNDPYPPPGGQPWDRPAPPPGYGPPPDGPPPVGPQPGNTLAVVGLILGILSLCTSALTGIPALICSFVALGRGPAGRGMAITGMILGAIGTLMAPVAIAILIGLMLPAIQKVREAAGRANDQNNMKIVGISLHNHQDTTTRLPAVDGPLSWRVHVLPFMEQDALFRSFDKKQAWDSAANRAASSTVVKEFRSADDPPGTTETHQRVFTGPGTLFDPVRPARLALIPDGSSNTILVAESEATVPWAAPRELPYSRTAPVPALGLKTRSVFLVTMADGSVRSVNKKVNEGTLRAAITANGGEPIGADW